MPEDRTFLSLLVFIMASVAMISLDGCRGKEPVSLDSSMPVPDKVDFNFHIKPILSDRCFPCHGPDKNALKAELRLDLAEGGLHKKLESGGKAFVPGRPGKSKAFQRILSSDPELQMPPPDFKRDLSNYEIALIERWIEQGAQYKPHWAFITPRKPDLPSVTNSDWCRNEIDYFILNKLQERLLTPNKKADSELLLRRATLDLTGLPPTPQEIENFLSDTNSNAFERVVDRLLASPHFGERMARPWLDLARYADSNGYSQDGLRIMWPWREWVIKAYNDNLPYDEFLTWQLAGDRLPSATDEQRLATGFLRNHRQNGEGGIVDEEYRIEYAADRTETAATVFLGLTMQCARCHDHKYDPLSQKEYYQFFSFFNNINERGITASDGNSGPEMVIKSKAVKHDLDSIDQVIQTLLQKSDSIRSSINVNAIPNPKLDLNSNCLADISFDAKSDNFFINKRNPNDQLRISGNIEQLNGVIKNGIKITAFDWVNISKDEIKFDRSDPFSFSFYFKYDTYDPYISILNHLSSKADNFPGYEIALYEGAPMLRLIHSLPAIVIQVQGANKIPLDTWLHMVFTYDGSGTAKGIKLFINGVAAERKIVFDNLSQGIKNEKGALTIGGRIPYNDSNKGYGFVDELKIYNHQLSAIEVGAIYNSRTAENYSDADRVDHFLMREDPDYSQLMQEIQNCRKTKFAIEDTLVSVMVMEDLETPRPTYVLDRGVYDAPLNQVYPAFPEAIFSASHEPVSDRLALAQWLVDDKHPLTARVAINRLWQMIFGQGLVKTTEDFGNQGALPSHPELLDWLAVTFRESGWNVKALLKKILLSNTYQQSSRVDFTMRSEDPDNIFLARGPSQRLSAEQIRDCALAASGLLNREIGGPSVMPYQPSGLWEEKGEFTQLKTYKQDTGVNLYRRSLYTFWRRTSPPPSMTTFDAPTRDICTPARLPTNTPLQALVMLNDPQFVEAARVLAERVIKKESNKRNQLEQAYRLLTGIRPKAEVIYLLLDLFEKEKQRFDLNPDQASALFTVGEYEQDVALDMIDVAATAIVCSTIMSFDETLIKR